VPAYRTLCSLSLGATRICWFRLGWLSGLGRYVADTQTAGPHSRRLERWYPMLAAKSLALILASLIS
jgi:hypothetical protein